MMSAIKPAELTLAILKATEGFTVIMDRPMDNNLIEIRQLLVPVLMQTTYDELRLRHNLVGVRYEKNYKKGAYAITPVISLYDDNIDKDATRLEINQAEGKHEARQNNRQLYETADNACRSFIMTVVDETWYKELEDPNNFYTKVTAINLLEHLTEFCAGLLTVDAVDIPDLMKELYKDLDGVPQFINALGAAQRKSKQAKLVVNDE